MTDDLEGKARADALIAEAEALGAAGALDEAAPLFLLAAESHAPYASFALVAGDSLYESGRLEEAAEAYRVVVTAVPDHEQAWESLALVLYELDRPDEAGVAMAHHDELAAGITDEDVTDAISSYWDARETDERVEPVLLLVQSRDERVSDVLFHFVRLAADDRIRLSRGQDYWAALAMIMVRFGMAGFVFWYSDGPAPDREAIAADVDRFVDENSGPPPLERQQAVRSSPPPPPRKRSRRRPSGNRRWWRRDG